ncbi:hypothetical protein FRC17_009574 [Serendipita sp. 399]|nr:hypothetical protein FRC17_009574 [Serendipita sp. 399]
MPNESENIQLSEIENRKNSHEDSSSGYGSGWESLGRERGAFKQYSTDAHIRSETHWRILLIVGGLLVALGIAAGHHFYLSSVANRDLRLSRSQFWVRAINNLLSHVVAITLVIICTYSTLQAVWYTASSRPNSILTLNRLFSLPTAGGIWGLFQPPYSIHLFPPLLLAISVQALVLVTVLAPNALSAGQGPSNLVDIKAPTLDLSETEMTLHQPNQTMDAPIAPRWEQILSAVMTAPPTTYWRIPQGCGAACSYGLTYSAPGLDCRDLEESEITIGRIRMDYNALCIGNNMTFYQGNTGFVPGNIPSVGDGTYRLFIQYMPGDARTMVWDDAPCPFASHPPRGATCTVRETEYQMIYHLSNNIQTVSSSVTRYGDLLTDNNTTTVAALNGRALSRIFSTAFLGDIQYRSLLPVTNLSNELAVRRVFTFQESPINFNLTNENFTLKEVLVDLFANMTMGLMAFRTENVTVQALVWDGSIVWKYDRHTLLLIYGAALVSSSLASLYGMFCLWRNEGAIDPTFATFLLTVTRTEYLYKHFKTIQDMKEVEETKLQFSSKDESFILHTT